MLSVLGGSIFGSSGLRQRPHPPLLLMVLTSAAASTQTTILPTARTTLSMAVYKAIPEKFARIHPRFLTPTWSTVAMGGISIILYVIMNYISAENVISDSVTALGVLIAFYYGLTGLVCFWFTGSLSGTAPVTCSCRGSCPYSGGRSCGPSAATAWSRTGSPRAAIPPGTSPASAGI